MAELSLLSAKFLKQEPGSPGLINRQGFIHPAATMALHLRIVLGKTRQWRLANRHDNDS